jgi:hypothetical protein
MEEIHAPIRLACLIDSMGSFHSDPHRQGLKCR